LVRTRAPKRLQRNPWLCRAFDAKARGGAGVTRCQGELDMTRLRWWLMTLATHALIAAALEKQCATRPKVHVRAARGTEAQGVTMLHLISIDTSTRGYGFTNRLHNGGTFFVNMEPPHIEESMRTFGVVDIWADETINHIQIPCASMLQAIKDLCRDES
jgi:hypothetical protein